MRKKQRKGERKNARKKERQKEREKKERKLIGGVVVTSMWVLWPKPDCDPPPHHYQPTKEQVSLSFLKLGSLKFRINKYPNFRVLVKQLFMEMKFNFKFQNWEQIYKGCPCKKKSMVILCKTNPDQNCREFFS